jgi:hypothetical protein
MVDEWEENIHFKVLLVTQHILSNTRPVAQALQKADCDIVKACVDANTCKKVIREQRGFC